MENIEKALKDGLDSVGAEFKKEVAAIDAKTEAIVAQMNDDAKKTGESRLTRLSLSKGS
jgi:hypothetical protein